MNHNFIFLNRPLHLKRTLKSSFVLGQKEKGVSVLDFPDGYLVEVMKNSGRKRFLKSKEYKGIVLYTAKQAQAMVSSISGSNPIDVSSMNEHDCLPISGRSAQFVYRLSTSELNKIQLIENHQKTLEKINADIRQLIPDSLWVEREEYLNYLNKSYELFPQPR